MNIEIMHGDFNTVITNESVWNNYGCQFDFYILYGPFGNSYRISQMTNV